jgi:hypothetical protein
MLLRAYHIVKVTKSITCCCQSTQNGSLHGEWYITQLKSFAPFIITFQHC